MARLAREEKRSRRVTRLLTPLLTRREFVASAAAGGIAIATPGAMAAQLEPPTVTYRDALRMTYWLIWHSAAAEANGGAGDHMGGHPPGPLDVLNILPDQTPLAITLPNGGSLGVYQPRANPPDNEDRGNQIGVQLARHWIIWRIAQNFYDAIVNGAADWDQDEDYVLLNAARLGGYARGAVRAGYPPAPGPVGRSAIRQAFLAVKLNPVRKEIDTKPLSQPTPLGPRAYWCE